MYRPKEALGFLFLGQDSIPKGGSGVQSKRSWRLFTPNIQDPILRFQGFPSGVGGRDAGLREVMVIVWVENGPIREAEP